MMMRTCAVKIKYKSKFWINKKTKEKIYTLQEQSGVCITELKR
jgi:hypothetical protein